MRRGTASLLVGAHAFWWHPFAVAASWWRLFRWAPAMEDGRVPGILDPRLWLCFLVHDVGYLGCSNMDGDEGVWHPTTGARIVSLLCDLRWVPDSGPVMGVDMLGPWGRFCLCHSGTMSRIVGLPVSRLCYADKHAWTFTPWWIYLPGCVLTGELDEYMSVARKTRNKCFTPREWYEWLRSKTSRWAHLEAQKSEWARLHGPPVRLSTVDEDES